MNRRQTFALKLAVILALCLGIFGVRHFRKDIRSRYAYDKISILARFMAKEYCSCRFVVGQSEAYCHDFITAEIPLLGMRLRTTSLARVKVIPGPGIEEYENAVIARALLFTKAEARYTRHQGCLLQP